MVAAVLGGWILVAVTGCIPPANPVEDAAESVSKASDAAEKKPADHAAEAVSKESDAAKKQPVDKDWGTLKLRFLYQGKPPEPTPLIGVERAKTLGIPLPLSQDLAVGAQGELANVFVYLLPAEDQTVKIHTDYDKLIGEPVRLTAKAGIFSPHALTVWTKRPLELVNASGDAYAPMVNMQANSSFHLMLPSQTSLRRILPKNETLPAPVANANANWMKAWLLVRDNPYMAVSSKDGTLTIKNLPVGEWEFQLWHEKWGYLSKVAWNGKSTAWYRGRPTFTIKPGENDFGTVKVDPKAFEK